MAQRTDCYDEQDSTDSAFETEVRANWLRVAAWAAIPPAVILPLTWFLFGRKRRTKDVAAQDAGPQPG